MKKKPLVVVTRKLPEPVEARMRELFDVRLNATDAPMDRAALAAAFGEAEVLVPTVTDRIDQEILSLAGPQLTLIANFGAGVDHIDVAAAGTRGITVTNTPGVLTEDTADIAMALILALPRRMVEGARYVEQLETGREWPGWSPSWMVGKRLAGRALGIVGMGRIGQAVAKRAKVFGLAIHYHNRGPVAPAIAETLEATYWPDLDRMLAAMDIVSVNCPSTPATHHLLAARRLKLLKSEAILVNTARGSIVDETALIELLEADAIAGAGLDVYENEPVIDPRLIALARKGKAVLLPHLGSGTIESRVAMGEKVIINIRTAIDGHRPPDRVLPTSP